MRISKVRRLERKSEGWPRRERGRGEEGSKISRVRKWSLLYAMREGRDKRKKQGKEHKRGARTEEEKRRT